MTETVFQFPISQETDVRVRIIGARPTLAQLCKMVMVLDDLIANMSSARFKAIQPQIAEVMTDLSVGPEIEPESLPAENTPAPFRRFIDEKAHGQIVRRFLAKEPISAIATATGFTTQAITEHLDRHGLRKIKRQKRTEQEKAS